MKESTARRLLSAVCTLICADICATLPDDIAHGVVNRWETPSAVAYRLPWMNTARRTT